jgi:hypothetical protein
MNDNYLKYMNAFANLVAEAAAHTHAVVYRSGDAGKDQPEFVQVMREMSARHLKKLSAEDEENQVLSRALGQYFGALVSHLSGIVAKWQTVRSDAKNPLIDLQDLSASCCREVLTRAGDILDAANAYASSLWLLELELTSKSNLFARQIEVLAHRNSIFYRSTGGVFSFDIIGCSCSQRSPGVHSLGFLYWDGADAIGMPMSALFVKAEDRTALTELANQCFGTNVKLSDDLNTLTVNLKVPLVKPC